MAPLLINMDSWPEKFKVLINQKHRKIFNRIVTVEMLISISRLKTIRVALDALLMILMTGRKNVTGTALKIDFNAYYITLELYFI